jgi:hypothetical protein
MSLDRLVPLLLAGFILLQLAVVGVQLLLMMMLMLVAVVVFVFSRGKHG